MVTKEKIEELIESAEYHHHDNKVTVCFLKLKNDFYIIGTSGCIDRTKFDKALGEFYALENAKNKIWELEGYHLAK